MERVAIFVDGANMFYAQKLNGWFIDWKLLYQLYTDNRDIYGAFYFTATPRAGDTEKIKRYRKFRGALIYNNYEVIDKEVREIRDESGQIVRLKGNLDIEMVFRMLTGAHQYDEAIIVGCDIDYVPVIQHLRNIGKKVTIIDRRKSAAIDLINACDKFADLEGIHSRIEREQKRREELTK